MRRVKIMIHLLAIVRMRLCRLRRRRRRRRSE